MARYACPHCEKETISSRDKYLMGLWLTRTCPHCGTRLCANPYLMFVIYFFYLWNLFWWPVVAYLNGNSLYVVPMVLIWAMLDFINVRYMPLLCLKRKKPA
jgi:hypothetical protein